MQPNENQPSENQAPTPGAQPTDPSPQTITPENVATTEVFTPQKSRKKKNLLILIIVLFVALGAAGAYWATQMKDKNTPVATTAPPAATQTQTTTLDTVAYSFGDTATADAKLFWRPAAGGDKTAAGTLGDKNVVSQSETYKNTAFATTTPGAGSKDGPAIWYSADAGKTYTKIYSVAPSQTDTQPGTQITSTKFSSDGKKIVFGQLGSLADTNSVREIDVKSKVVSDLFSVKSTGVYLEGYDAAKKQVYYYTGCTQCDGVTRNKLLVQNLSDKTEAVVFEKTDKGFTDETVINNSFSKILIIRSSPSELLGGGKPFTIEEYDMAGKAFKTILTVNEDLTTAMQVGYTNEGAVYYSKGDSVYRVNSSGTTDTMFQSAKPILKVYYVSQKEVIASAGESADYTLNNYNLGTKKSVAVLSGDNNTTIFGVTTK